MPWQLQKFETLKTQMLAFKINLCLAPIAKMNVRIALKK